MSLPIITLPARPEGVSEVLDPAAAFERVRLEIAAVPPEQAVPVNTEVKFAVGRVLGAGPKLESLLPGAAGTMLDFTAERLRHLRDLALALSYAHAVSMTGGVGEAESLPALQDSGTQLRDRLLGDARYLVSRGVFDGKRLGQVRALNGYSNLAYGLLALVSLFRGAWPQVAGKCATSEDDLSKAEEVARRILQALTTREQTASEPSRMALTRLQAYALLFREYDAIRRMVAYLRWDEDDADDFAPSLVGRRGPRRDRATPSTPPPPVAPEKEPTSSGADASKATHEPTVPHGQPGGSPFIS